MHSSMVDNTGVICFAPDKKLDYTMLSYIDNKNTFQGLRIQILYHNWIRINTIVELISGSWITSRVMIPIYIKVMTEIGF